MQHAILLIDKAIKTCGSAAELARRMGVNRAEITKLKQGNRPISPATAAELADIAGEDARQAAIDAVIEGAKGTRREDVLREILGKGLAAGVVGVLAISYSDAPTSATEKIAASDQAAEQPIHRIYSKVSECAEAAGRFLLRKTGLWPTVEPVPQP